MPRAMSFNTGIGAIVRRNVKGRPGGDRLMRLRGNRVALDTPNRPVNSWRVIAITYDVTTKPSSRCDHAGIDARRCVEPQLKAETNVA